MKKLFYLFLLSIFCLAGAATWLYLHKEDEAQSAIKKQLTAFGLDVKELKVSECGLTVCKISKLRIGEDDLLIENAAAQYSASTLMEKRVSAIVIDSVSMRIYTKPDAMKIAGYNIKANASAASSPVTIPSLTINELSIKTLTIIIDDGKVRNRFVIDGIKLVLLDAKSQNINISSILHDAKLPFFIPLSLQINSTIANNILSFSGVVKDTQTKALNLDFKGSWDANTQTTKIEANLKPLVFDTGVLQPRDIAPLLAEFANQVKGAISAKLALSMDAKETKQSASVTLKQVSADISGVVVDGANGVLQFRSLSPLLTAGKQTVTVNRMQAGVPLTNGQIQFEMTPDKKVTLHPMKWDWSGGSLVTDKMIINPNAPLSEQIRLHVRQIDLNSLLALVLDKGIVAQGKLDGTIPIRISNGHVLIDKATLMATAPGNVIYKPEDASIAQSGGAQTELLMKALENFQFSLLSMSVDSKENGNTVVGLKVSGGNPDLYGGKAIELNVNLQGRLEEIIRSNMDAYALPSKLEKQLQEKLP